MLIQCVVAKRGKFYYRIIVNFPRFAAAHCMYFEYTLLKTLQIQEGIFSAINNYYLEGESKKSVQIPKLTNSKKSAIFVL